MNTIAILACCDTKLNEMLFLRKYFLTQNIDTLFLDISLGPDVPEVENRITREELIAASGRKWEELRETEKHEKMLLMIEGLKKTVPDLFQKQAFQGIMCIGGLQNMTIGSAAMQALPVGVPKMIVSTVASGSRKFSQVVGARDIVVMPSLCDFTGLNEISRTILTNAAAAMTGMTTHAGQPFQCSGKQLIGSTFMGANNDMASRAIKRLQDAGSEVVSFHSTGTGGKLLEEFIETGVITAVMDLSLHETVYEYFGNRGFGEGAPDRLLQGARKGIPMVVCPGCIDFMCITPEDLKSDRFFPEWEKRKYIWHNPALAHVKLTPEEAEGVASLLVSRLNQAKGEVRVLLPQSGLRSLSRPGDPLYDEDVDAAVAGVFASQLRPDIPCIRYAGNFDDPEFADLCADTMLQLTGETI